MAVRIRLKRIGKNVKGRAYYRIVVLDETRSRDGRSIEEIGSYDPFKATSTIKLERYDYWVSKGGQPSATVKSLYKKSKKA
ncbi:MAG: 30S ribosomal protein S16 [Candidatus Omnitrophota bacterium]|jgi:small subunit ribosomal protein S16